MGGSAGQWKMEEIHGMAWSFQAISGVGNK
jgi:hypothetical protein